MSQNIYFVSLLRFAVSGKPCFKGFFKGLNCV
nr:MAG TPA: hypothetical protein [Caudoviricetes sp.]